MDFHKIVSNTKNWAEKNQPTLMIAGGIVLYSVGTVLAVKATPKAIKAKRDLERHWAKEENLPSKPKQIFETGKACGKYYVAAIACHLAATTLVLGANHISLKRTATYASAYSIAKKGYDEYKAKVIQHLGPDKEKRITDEIAADRIAENPVPNDIQAVNGKQLCYDCYSGRYFYSTVEEILTAVNEINRRLFVEGYVPLNEFYYELELPQIKLGNDVGWTLDEDDSLAITFSSQLNEKNDPCLVLQYSAEPRYDPKNYYKSF